MINWSNVTIPASAEQIERDRDAMPRELGSGAFVLVTHAFVLKPGEVVPFAMTHRFETAAQRDVFAAWAKDAGLRVEVIQ